MRRYIVGCEQFSVRSVYAGEEYEVDSSTLGVEFELLIA